MQGLLAGYWHSGPVKAGAHMHLELLWMEMQVPPFRQCKFPQVRESFSQVAPTKPWGGDGTEGVRIKQRCPVSYTTCVCWETEHNPKGDQIDPARAWRWCFP